MAINLRGLCRLNIPLANNAFFKYNFINVGVRFLYTEQDLGITAYENMRYVYRNQFMTIENTFRDKMQEICRDQNGVVYTEDLKAMVHLAQSTESDLQLLKSMLVNYIHNQEDKKLGKYVFGPVIMRMYYHLNQPHYALEAFDNDILRESFDYRTSFRTLMCLLYKNNMYKEMRETYQKVIERCGMELIGSANVLMYAGCLKEGTPEALEYSLNQWRYQYDKLKPSTRSSSMLSYLAIKNNKPEIALDIMGTVPLSTVMSVRGLKMLAYANLGRYMQVIPILKYGIEQNSRNRPQFFADVIYDLEDKLKAGNVGESNQILNLIEQARKQDFIQSTYTLEEFILKPMTYMRRFKGKLEDREDRRRFRNRQSYQSQQKTEFKDYM